LPAAESEAQATLL